MPPTAEQREFVAALNTLSADHSSAGFGNPGRQIPSKAKRQLAFAYSAWSKWPHIGGGDLKTVPVEEWRLSKVDPTCPFWLEGQRQYLAALDAYWEALQAPSCDDELRRSLLADLGFHMMEDFILENEESEMIAYWGQAGPTFDFGTVERISGRRWYNYGPVLPRETQGTTKSTLTVIPAVFGAMPPVVKHLGLQGRIRDRAETLLGVRDHPAFAGEYNFDQMYVNFYDSAARANIDFHHDNHSCMRGAVAGLSLLNDCVLQLRPPLTERGVQRPPLRIHVPRRSLFFMSGLSRWHLQHGIPYMPHNRLSLTFRTVDKTCYMRETSGWGRHWKSLEPEEAENTIWPLVCPDGNELHCLFPNPQSVAWRSDDYPEGGTAVADGTRQGNVARRTTIRTPCSSPGLVPSRDIEVGPPSRGIMRRQDAPEPDMHPLPDTSLQASMARDSLEAKQSQTACSYYPKILAMPATNGNSAAGTVVATGLTYYDWKR